MISMTNLIPNASLERNESWSGITYDSANALFGVRSQKLPAGTSVATCPMPTPVLGHKYYGRHYLKSNGTNSPADCRFEWFSGDGSGYNFVFGRNNGNYPEWGMESAVIHITVLNGTSFVMRSFVVNGTAEMWADGFMIVDLTETFGAGNEPDKAWCDENIPFFEGTETLPIYQIFVPKINDAVFGTNPVNINGSTKLTVSVTEEAKILLPQKIYSGELFSGEV